MRRSAPQMEVSSPFPAGLVGNSYGHATNSANTCASCVGVRSLPFKQLVLVASSYNVSGSNGSTPQGELTSDI